MAEKKISITEQNLLAGLKLIKNHPLFSRLSGGFNISGKEFVGKDNYSIVYPSEIYFNRNILLQPENWAYIAAHSLLHISFGHFDAQKMPNRGKQLDLYLWNKACDLYIAKFLEDIRFGISIWSSVTDWFRNSMTDEIVIYEYLIGHKGEKDNIELLYTGFGTAPRQLDMRGLEHPLSWNNRRNPYMAQFAYALAASVTHAVSIAGGHTLYEGKNQGKAVQAASWFISQYPLLGALAAGFTIIEDEIECRRLEIRTAAVNVMEAKIYVNPCFVLTKEELRFVLAHEYLHAGLMHQKRCQGRDAYFWNVACDYVINGWLYEMQIGSMPQDALYDEELKGKSAEEIYDQILRDLKKYRRLCTFRGYGAGDILNTNYDNRKLGVDLDEFYRNALSQGLELEQSSGRGLIPAGLIEEIRALAMPPIPWDVKLARWFDAYFPPIVRTRTYAKPSRRQSSSPNIPRPGYLIREELLEQRTFGVILDTSGSMDAKLLGKALGAIASYAQAREVPFLRVIFCDAAAYDAGYLAPEEIAGRVNIKGRGGTILQAGVEKLLHTNDFPPTAPILFITDAQCEPDLIVPRTHAFLIPKGTTLPFQPKGKVFQME